MPSTRRTPFSIVKKILKSIANVGYRFKDSIKLIKEELIENGVSDISNSAIKKKVIVYQRRNKRKRCWIKVKAARKN